MVIQSLLVVLGITVPPGEVRIYFFARERRGVSFRKSLQMMVSGTTISAILLLLVGLQSLLALIMTIKIGIICIIGTKEWVVRTFLVTSHG